MNEREKFILRGALIYMLCNLEDVMDAFWSDSDGTGVVIDGMPGEPVTEDEVQMLIHKLKGENKCET